VGIDPLAEKRKKIKGGFKMADMGGTGIGNEGEWIVSSQASSKSHPLWQGIEDVTEGIPKFHPSMGEVKILGQKGKVFITGMKASLIVMSPLVGPYLFTKNFDGLSGTRSQGLQFFAGAKTNENVPQIKKEVSNPSAHIRS
jgi:hypothetical protein